jgi:hypothetical protein
MATASDNLAAAYASLTVIVRTKTAEWEANGCPATYSIDGESVQWNEWLSSRLAELKGMRDEMQAASGPFIARGYGRA